MLAWVFAGIGCGPGPDTTVAITAADVRSERLTGRPPLTLVQRAGDPQAGLSMAVRVATSARAANAVGQLVRLRLAASAHANVVVNPNGLIVSTLLEGPASAAAVLSSWRGSLLTAVSAREHQSVLEQWRASPPRFAASGPEAELARCSGEMLLSREEAASLPTRAELSAWQSALGLADVAFAAVGPPEELKAVRRGVEGLAAWRPSRAGAPASPPESAAGAWLKAGDEQTLSLGLTGLPADVATAAVERLGRRGSVLSRRMAADFPSWEVGSVIAALSPTGGCVRADFRAFGAVPSVAAVRRSVAIALDEIRSTLERTERSEWFLTKQVLARSSPDEAAAVAAWQRLHLRGQQAASSPRRGNPTAFVHYTGPVTDPKRLDGLSADPLWPPESLSLPSVRRLEPGQGELWVLVASPCGTLAEDAESAGLLALLLRSLARDLSGENGVEVEPWITANGAGLLAHAGPVRPDEQPSTQAERVARALAAGLIAPGPSSLSVSEERSLLGREVGGASLPAFWLALRQSTGNHPSWLEPRGSWRGLSQISTRAVELERRRFASGPLRLAIVGNYDEEQIDVAEQRLQSILAGVRTGAASCPPAPELEPVTGRYALESPTATGGSATLVVALPPRSPAGEAAAQWTAALMNRQGGWLHKALAGPGFVASARARVMGAGARRALVIEIVSLEGQQDAAAAQVRGLLERLRTGAASEADFRWASRHFDAERRRRLLSPRARIVDLWRGEPREAEPSLDLLRAFHARAFQPGREILVLSSAPG